MPPRLLSIPLPTEKLDDFDWSPFWLALLNEARLPIPRSPTKPLSLADVLLPPLISFSSLSVNFFGVFMIVVFNDSFGKTKR